MPTNPNKIIRVYLTTDLPDRGPHERDTLNGFIYRLIGVRADGDLQHCGWLLEARFDNPQHSDDRATHFSWGLRGIKAASVFEAEAVAKRVLGDLYKGLLK